MLRGATFSDHLRQLNGVNQINKAPSINEDLNVLSGRTCHGVDAVNKREF
jgi:hypothetical protein